MSEFKRSVEAYERACLEQAIEDGRVPQHEIDRIQLTKDSDMSHSINKPVRVLPPRLTRFERQRIMARKQRTLGYHDGVRDMLIAMALLIILGSVLAWALS